MQTRNSQSVSTNGPLTEPQNPQRNSFAPRRRRQRWWAGCQQGPVGCSTDRAPAGSLRRRMDPKQPPVVCRPCSARGDSRNRAAVGTAVQVKASVLALRITTTLRSRPPGGRSPGASGCPQRCQTVTRSGSPRRLGQHRGASRHHPAWQPGQAEAAAEGGAGRRPAQGGYSRARLLRSRPAGGWDEHELGSERALSAGWASPADPTIGRCPGPRRRLDLQRCSATAWRAPVMLGAPAAERVS
jgi:hypothetical protein